MPDRFRAASIPSFVGAEGANQPHVPRECLQSLCNCPGNSRGLKSDYSMVRCLGCLRLTGNRAEPELGRCDLFASASALGVCLCLSVCG